VSCGKIPSMPALPRRSALLVPVLLITLALFAPVVAATDGCVDCGLAQGCCSSLGCPCCLPGSSVLTPQVRVELGPASTGLAGQPPADRRLSVDPRDVFHVPKSPLA
jgi:hypothetical protein